MLYDGSILDVKKQQVAWAKIILHIEASELPHACYDNPKEIWENLEQVHHACGFATHLLNKLHSM